MSEGSASDEATDHLREIGPHQLLQLGVMLLVIVVLMDRSVKQHRAWRRVARRLVFLRERLR